MGFPVWVDTRVWMAMDEARCLRENCDSFDRKHEIGDEELAAGLALLLVEREGSGQLGVRAFGEDAQDEGGIEGEGSHGCQKGAVSLRPWAMDSRMSSIS